MVWAEISARGRTRLRASMLSALRRSAVALAAAALLLCGVAAAFAQSSDLIMSKSGPATTSPNSDIAYTLTATNNGPDDAGTTTLADPLPAGTTFVSFAQNTGPTFSCSTPSVGASGTVNCSIAGLVNGATATFTLTVHVPSGATPGSFITNIATIDTATDPTPENNSGVATTQVNGGTSADLSLSKAAPANVGIGQNFSYTIVVANAGPDAAASASLTDVLPPGLTFVSLSSPAGWNCTTPAVGGTGTVTCTNPSVAPNPGQTFTLTMNVPGGTAGGTEFDNTAAVSSATSDPAPENNSEIVASFAVAPAPDLTISKSHSGSAQLGQIGFTYTIVVSNAGTGPTSGLVTVTDVVPAGMTATAISGSGWNCTVGATSTCNRSDSLASGAAYPPITLTVNIASNAAALVTNTATVSGGGDTTPGNNTASDPTIVTAGPAPDLTIAKSHSGNAHPGQNGFVYRITVSNVGSAPSTGTVTVTDTLPPGLTATAASGTGWACSPGATVTCTRTDALAAGAAYPTIIITVNVATTAAPSIINTATVSGGGDVNPANNTASDQTNVRPRPDPTQDPDVVGLINAQMASAQRFATTQISNFNDRLEALHDDNTRDQMMQIGAPGSDPCDATRRPGDPFDQCCLTPPCLPTAARPFADPSSEALAYSRTERTQPLFKAPPKPVAPPRRDWAVWSTGYVALGSTGANSQRSGVDFTTSGISAGVDYRFNRYFIAGLGVGYGRDSTDIGTNGTHSNAEAYSTAVYASLRPFRSFFIDSLVGYGTLKFGSQRFVVDDADFVFGQRTGKEMFASLTSSYEFRQGNLLLSPYARVNAAWITLDQFSETGGAGGALTYSAQTANIFTSVLGVRAKYTWLTTWGAVVPRARVEYNHDFNGSSAITLNYADTPIGQTFALTTTPAQRDRVTIGLGTDFLFGDGLRLAADYREEVDFLGTQWHLFKLRLDARF
jgi:uncharacterized repeat protein (TIGR01451 family)